jgi:TRAP-type uncharacterized transport system fused permease subunit
MEDWTIFKMPAFRILVFLAIVGIFFYKEQPRAHQSSNKMWRSYVWLALYWLWIALLYYALAQTMSSGTYELLARQSTASPELIEQITITSLILLFLYRWFSRYFDADESIRFAEETIRDFIVSYLAISFIFFAYQEYLGGKSQPVYFSNTGWVFAVWGIAVLLDFLLWLGNKPSLKSQ